MLSTSLLFIASCGTATAALRGGSQATATAMPTVPTTYGVTLTWSQELPTGVAHFKHQRWYDLKAQKYRDDTFSTSSGDKVDEVLQLPGEKKRYDDNTETGVCSVQQDESHIDGFIKTYPDMKVEDDTVKGVKAKKYSKDFTGYTVAVWFADGDEKVKDGTPLQTYNSYNEQQGVMVKGLTTISDYVTSFDADKTFALPDSCKTPITPAPTESSGRSAGN